MKQAKIKDEKY